MGFLTKKESTSILPDLPSLPEIPMNNDSMNNSSMSPPSAYSQDSNSTPIIRQIEVKKLPELPNYDQEIKEEIRIVDKNDSEFYRTSVEGMQKSSFDNNQIKRPMMPAKVPPKILPPYNPLKKEEGIFVKIKKFENAMSSFDEIKKRVDDMKKDIEKAKKIIEDEAKELQQWETQVTNIKQGLEHIDKSLFSELDS